jgi:Ca-activated chloride channel family protein
MEAPGSEDMADMNDRQTPRAMVDLTVRQEKTLLRPTGSRRHVVFGVRANLEETAAPITRRPLTLALTLDRSGSMSGEPLRMAKQVALSLIDSLTEQDEAAIVIFDDKIETLQELATMTPAIKAQVRQALERVEARGSTALHEAWLTSCKMLASDDPREARLARCYLLTDGLANVGETDVETIATQAAGVRENAGVGTSAFGLGPNYNEHLLGPWAVAGGGQFHHLRTVGDLAKTFMGERDELLAVVALRTRLEVTVTPGMSAEMISAYRLAEDDRKAERWQVDIGDLLNGEERDVVVRFSFPRLDKAYSYTVRSRVLWIDDRGEQSGPWQEITFTSASDEACADEPRDAETMRWIGLAHAERTKLRALKLAKGRDSDGALKLIRQAITHINDYAGDDTQLRAAVSALGELAGTIERGGLTEHISKETYYQSQAFSRKQRNLRGD